MKKRVITILSFVLCFCALFIIPVSAVLMPVEINRVTLRAVNSSGGLEFSRNIAPWGNDDNYYFYFADLDDENIDLVVSLDIRPSLGGRGPVIDDAHAYSFRFVFLGFDSPINPYPADINVYVSCSIFNNTTNQTDDFRLELPVVYLVNQGAATDSDGVIYNVYNCSWSHRGTDILADLAQKIDSSAEYDYSTLRFSEVHVVLPYVSSGGSSSPQYEFGFSRNFVFDVISNENADSSALDGIQGAIEEQNNYQTGIDTNTPNNDFNNASDDYGQLEEDLYSQIDQDSVSGVIESGEGVFTDLAQYASTLGLVSMCFGVFVGLPGISLYVILCLTFIVAGIFLNNRYRGNGNSDRNYQSRDSRDKK